MGLPPLEALASGTPALVKDNDLNREVYGNHAFFSDSETDPPTIAEAMTRALQDTDHRQKILVHRQEIIAKFDWSKHTAQFLDQLRCLCQK
jgi:glycosyltransferase involved in cell wall biosynthesis